jgi:hypothetical protein
MKRRAHGKVFGTRAPVRGHQVVVFRSSKSPEITQNTTRKTFFAACVKSTTTFALHVHKSRIKPGIKRSVCFGGQFFIKKKAMKPRVIIIAGAPGSGKGTQCKLLARERG